MRPAHTGAKKDGTMIQTDEEKTKVFLCVEAMNCLTRYSEILAFKADEEFSQSIFHEWKDLGIVSPIEQVLYCAIHFVREIQALSHFDMDRLDGEEVCSGFYIKPQYTIGKYRVDFLVEMYPLQKVPQGKAAARKKSVIVECDSQAWHERTEKERRYEKARDRELIRKGYQVFHYTGKEILDDPSAVAAEVVAHVTGATKESILKRFMITK